MTTDEAAALLGIRPRTLYTNARDHEKTGFPQPQRLGRTLLWARQELLEWRENHPARSRKTIDANPEADGEDKP